MNIVKSLTTALLVFGVTAFSLAQDEIFLYGKVTTTDGKVYEGPIRWGKEEVYWVDIFNAGKEMNENLRYLSSDEREELDDRHYHNNNNWAGGNWGNWKRWVGNWENERYRDRDYTHQFACQFGDIKTITPSGRRGVRLEMKTGGIISLDGEGYNDVDTDVRVVDPELGEVQLDWYRIDKVEFMKAPKTIPNKFGKPLYGTVEAFGEKYTGYIQWDHDERLETDKLDGDTDDGDVSIEFSKITSIERRGGGSQVILKSGRELRMDDSNDVDNGNRGIIIMTKDLAEIDVPWDEFQKLTLTTPPAGALPTYDQFAQQKELNGTVTTEDGQKLTGKIVFDLDEEFNFELLQGKRGEIEYVMPFRNIKKVEPFSEYRCEIELTSGQKIVLDDAQDVNERNQGLLVFASSGSEPKYVRWDKVKTVEFK